MVLDLDETLVHSSFIPTKNRDFQLKLSYNFQRFNVHVKKRPFVEEFLLLMSSIYEIVYYTASLSEVTHMLAVV